MEVFIMENGNIMQKMDGECTRIRVKGIDMLANGRRIESGAMVNKAH